MPSTFVPARAVALPAAPRARVSRRVRELAMLLALAAPAALAQQSAQNTYDVSMGGPSAGSGDLAADKWAVSGGLNSFGGTSSGGSFTATSGMNGLPPTSGAAGDSIFTSSFD